MQEVTKLAKVEGLWKSLLRNLHLSPVDELVVDLGSANTHIYVPKTGTVISEPSLIAIEIETRQVIAVGREALLLVGREPQSVTVLRPIRAGVVTDCRLAAQMLKKLLHQAMPHQFFSHPTMLLCVSSGLTRLERKALEEVAIQAGAYRCGLIESTLMAAVGEVDEQNKNTSMVVDVGAGKLDVAVISRGKLIYSATERRGVEEINTAIAQYLRHKRGVEAGINTLEKLKVALGTTHQEDGSQTVEIGCRSLSTRLPSVVHVTNDEIHTLLEPFFRLVEHCVRTAFEALPTEASVDLLDSGILLCGGGARLAGLSEWLRQHTKIRTRVVAEPELASILGAGRLVGQTGRSNNILGEPLNDADVVSVRAA